MVAAKTSRKPQSMAENFAPSDSMAESSAQPIPGGCHGRVGRASATNAENACERFFWALQGVNYNVYGIVSASGDLVERYEYTPYGRRTVYSRGWLRWDMTGDGVVDSADYDIYLRDRSKRGKEASAADINGDGWVNGDEDHWEDFFEWYAGQSVADDPLVMHSRLESFRTDSRQNYYDPPGGYGSLCDIGHQGLLHDKEFGPAGTGLIHNRARTLNPPLARFNQRDPLGYPDGMSGYEYVRSDPTDTMDWTGMASKESVVAKAIVWFGAAEDWDRFESGISYFHPKLKRRFVAKWGITLRFEMLLDNKSGYRFQKGGLSEFGAKASYNLTKINSDTVQEGKYAKRLDQDASDVAHMKDLHDLDSSAYCVECRHYVGSVDYPQEEQASLAKLLAKAATDLFVPPVLSDGLKNGILKDKVSLKRFCFRATVCADGKRAISVSNIPIAYERRPYDMMGMWIHSNIPGKDASSDKIVTKTGSLSRGHTKNVVDPWDSASRTIKVVPGKKASAWGIED